MLPKARLDKLSIRELPDETLVHDLTTHKTHCLNPTAALVWRHCDGRTTLAELERQVQEKLVHCRSRRGGAAGAGATFAAKLAGAAGHAVDRRRPGLAPRGPEKTGRRGGCPAPGNDHQ